MKYNELNKEQRAAVLSDRRRILCLAGAGTGKTKTLVTRVARLIEEGVDPRKILMLTFTNAAAREQKERLIAMVGAEGEKVWASTFHSWAVRETRRYGQTLGYSFDFSIYDQEDTQSIIEDIAMELQYDEKTKDILDALEKNSVYGVPFPPGAIGTICNEYRFRCRRQNAIDIDSLISTLRRLLNNETIRGLLHREYEYVFVDEFQDTDGRQMELLNTIDPENLFVVGDDFQSIYGFRGSDVGIIMGLARDPEWETIKLEENYRSTRQIVNTANNLIKHNNQTEKILKAHRNGPNAAVIEKNTPGEEMDWIALKCHRLAYDDGTYMDTAILARTNRQVDAIAARLKEKGVPYVIRRKSSDALKTMESKKLFAFMQACVNPLDDEAVAAIVNWPEQRFSRQEMLRIEMFQLEKQCSLLTALETREEAQELVGTIKKVHAYIQEHQIEAIELYDNLVGESRIVWWNSEQGLHSRNAEIRKIRETLEEWQEARKEAGDTIEPLDWLEFYKMRMVEGTEIVEKQKDEVQLMTVHGSKGLEFQNVIIAGMNQKSFPINGGDLQEERRLCYVAITRAKTRLYLTRSLTRIVWGNHEEESEPSIFLEEL